MAEAMLGVFCEGVSRVIYCSLYVGLSDVRHDFEEAIFLMSTSKSRVITTSTMLRQLILCYEASVRDPQTLVSGVNSKLSAEGFPESLGVRSSMYALAGKKKVVSTHDTSKSPHIRKICMFPNLLFLKRSFF